jgi:hypothetical protein
MWGREGGRAKGDNIGYLDNACWPMMCVRWKVIQADVEKTCLSTILCHFWSWMSGCDGLWVKCGLTVGSWGWRALWVMS